MATYESLPVTCEAYQWFGGIGPGIHQSNVSSVFYVHGNRVFIDSGDWIVKEPVGDGYYPVKDEIFKKRWKLKC